MRETGKETTVLAVGHGLGGSRGRWILAERLAEEGFDVVSAQDQAEAISALLTRAPAVVLIDLALQAGSPLAIADFASYRHPGARVIYVSDGRVFADGSAFGISANAGALVSACIRVRDLAALINFQADAALEAVA